MGYTFIIVLCFVLGVVTLFSMVAFIIGSLYATHKHGQYILSASGDAYTRWVFSAILMFWLLLVISGLGVILPTVLFGFIPVVVVFSAMMARAVGVL